VGAFNAVSCATAAFCVATGWSTGTDYAITYNGRSWSAAQRVDQYVGEVESVSCPLVGWCAAVTDLVAVTVSQHGRWSNLAAVDQAPGPPYPGTVAAISCTSPEFCVVVDGQGNAETFNGRTWSRAELIDPDYPINAVSCGAPGHCVAVDEDGRALVLGGEKWSAPQQVDNTALTAISCAKVTFCEATDLFGHGLSYQDGHWSAPVRVDDLASTPVSLSCPEVGTCLGVDSQGADVVLTSRGWGQPQVIDSQSAPSGGLTGVSCPPGTTVFCAAVDTAGSVLTATAPFSG
jgi:hypothetical protein